LLAHWDRLDDSQRPVLTDEIRGLDLDELTRMLVTKPAVKTRRRRPPGRTPPASSTPDVAATAAEARRQVRVLREAQVGCAVAGAKARGSGFEHPKGMFSIGPSPARACFSLLEKTRPRDRYARRGRYNYDQPGTHDETVRIPREQVTRSRCRTCISSAGTMPAVDARRALLLRTRDWRSARWACGMLAALAAPAASATWTARGETCFYLQVDNRLATICDPEMIGRHVMAGSEYTLQWSPSRSGRTAGRGVTVDGRTRVIAYAICRTAAAAREPARAETLGGQHRGPVFAVDLRRMAESETGRCPFHRAHSGCRHDPRVNGRPKERTAESSGLL